MKEITKGQLQNIITKHFIKYFPHNTFRFSSLNSLIFIILNLMFLFFLRPYIEFPNFNILLISGVIVGYIVFLSSIQRWEGLIILFLSTWFVFYKFINMHVAIYLTILFAISSFLSTIFQIAKQWEKAVVLRFGKFYKVKGPGIFFILPFFDEISQFIDNRIRSTDFSAETSLTKDAVPVHVDGIAFWLVWDAKKVILEVENFEEAVILSCLTALRESVGKHNLDELLSNRDKLSEEIQKTIDAKVSSWGVTIQSIEITEIIIPKGLEDAISKQAQAERERQARIILSKAEAEIAEKFEEAAKIYANNDTALHLRAMNMLYEGLKKNGSLVLVPSSAVDSMSLGTATGLSAYKKTQEKNKNQGENHG